MDDDHEDMMGESELVDDGEQFLEWEDCDSDSDLDCEDS